MYYRKGNAGHPKTVVNRPLTYRFAGSDGSSLGVAGRTERTSCCRWMCCSDQRFHPQNRIEICSMEDPRQAAT